MRKENIKIITAFGTGIVIGGIAGILLAPQSGKETRKEFKESICKIKKKLKNLKEENVVEYIDKKLDEIDLDIIKLDEFDNNKLMKKHANKTIDKINNLIKYINKKGIDDFEELVIDLKDRVSDILESLD